MSEREKASRAKRTASQSPDAVSRNPLAKALSVLQWMTDEYQDDLGVREIALGTGLPPSTVHRILTDLTAVGLVQPAGSSRRYSLGPELSSLAWKFTARFPIRELAMPELESLVQATNETAFLAVFSRKRRQQIIVASIETQQQLRYVVPVNMWRPLSSGAGSLGMLAFMPKDEQQVLVEEIEQTRAGREKLARTLEETRQAG